jgi:acetyltransferase-like isoleucine patch superfamily enzyme
MVIGDRVQLVSTVAKLELVVESGGRLTVGSRSLINFGCSIVAVERISIGARCHIGPHCMIMDTAFHELDPDRRLESPEPRPIEIAENVWIGARVIVMPGVTIGAGSAVGAGSVVTHDVEPRTLVAGVPARFIRQI